MELIDYKVRLLDGSQGTGASPGDHHCLRQRRHLKCRGRLENVIE
ncbi:MAG: hypothetical protein ACLSGS_10080 [Adlercreutzia sp.]